VWAQIWDDLRGSPQSRLPGAQACRPWASGRELSPRHLSPRVRSTPARSFPETEIQTGRRKKRESQAALGPGYQSAAAFSSPAGRASARHPGSLARPLSIPPLNCEPHTRPFPLRRPLAGAPPPAKEGKRATPTPRSTLHAYIRSATCAAAQCHLPDRTRPSKGAAVRALWFRNGGSSCTCTPATTLLSNHN